ncbi:MAG: hypothetical protein KC505_02840, partial [Myxococcales bacterium]|nr:hypothetical protein [Myxococcales bacterium]
MLIYSFLSLIKYFNFNVFILFFQRTLLISKVREEYPDRIALTNTLIPNPTISSNVFETYNSILSWHQLVENTDISVLYDNEAIGRVCCNNNLPYFNMDDYNTLISRCMLGQTACDRFSSQHSMDLRKIASNSVCFPRLHFFLPSVTIGDKHLDDIFLDTMVNFDSDSMKLLSSANIKHGRFLSIASLFRGKQLSMKEIFKNLNDLKNKKSSYFVDYIPNNISLGVCDVPEKSCSTSATFLSNSTAVISIFKMHLKKFTYLFRRKAFLHHYLSEGMDEMEFTEAESNVFDLASEYQQYQEATANEESEY